MFFILNMFLCKDICSSAQADLSPHLISFDPFLSLVNRTNRSICFAPSLSRPLHFSPSTVGKLGSGVSFRFSTSRHRNVSTFGLGKLLGLVLRQCVDCQCRRLRKLREMSFWECGNILHVNDVSPCKLRRGFESTTFCSADLINLHVYKAYN